MKVQHRFALLIIALIGWALLAGCATPKALYDGPPLPRNKVVLISGFPFTKIQEGRDGKGNFVAASGQVVIIGIDGKIFNEKIYASYSGSQFLLLPGQHSLLAYCEYTFQLSPFRMAYSDLFTIQFTAKEGREYRYQADFWLDSGDDKTRHVRQNGIVAVPGIWDVTENRSADSSNRVNEAVKPVPVNYSDLSHLQAEIGKR